MQLYIVRMKRITYSKRAFAGLVALATPVFLIAVLLSACHKNPGGGGGTPNNSDVLYPATLSFYEGGNSGYPSVSTFKYDANHHLTYMGNRDRYWNISGNGVQNVIIGSIDTIIVNNTFGGDLYGAGGASLVSTFYINKNSYGSTSGPVNTYYFAGMGGAANTTGNYNGGTYTQFYTFDANGDVSFSKIVTNAVGSPNSSSYDPGGLDYDHITFKGYDSHPSPYSNIPGYKWAAWQWSYPWQMSLAHSKHNPTQIIEESLNTNTMKWSVYSQSDFTYTYNDQGYPSEIKVTTVYPSTGTPTKAFYQTYDFTYTK